VIMDQSTRRRSSSITGTAAASTRKEPRRHRRRDDHIAEEGEHSEDASDSGSRSDSTDLELDDMSADGLDDDEETGLTKKVRRKNARRKRRNTLLDQRVVPELSYTKEEKKLADQSLMRDMLVNVTLILLW
jgi:solute carrier family 35 protein C2